MTAANLRFVLFEPTHAGNVGAAARAIKTMGFGQLVLVNPACAVDEEARARSSGALDVLTAAPIVATLREAVADCGLVIGASARRRRLNWPDLDPADCARAAAEAAARQPVAVVFGPERSGLSNAELDLCHALVCIPSNPEYSSLNLAMAVQIIAYELRRALFEPVPALASDFPLATAGALALFYAHLERVLLASGFLDAGNPRHLMRRLRRVFNRAQLDENELNILRGMLSALVPGSGDQAAGAARRWGGLVSEAGLYFDYAASAPVDPAVAALMAECLADNSANPAAVEHAPGRRAAARVATARGQVAALIGARPDEIIWTSGATEADNLGIVGAVHFRRGRGDHVITATTEHPAVLESCRRLEREGVRVTWLAPDAGGIVSPAAVAAAITPRTVLVSLMLVNNEIGVVQDIAAVGALCREHDVLLHVDAAQAAGRVPIQVRGQGIHLLSLSAHKCGGPQGVGALFLDAERIRRVEPLLHGGGQERGLRPGTVPVHQVAGMGLACELAGERLAADVPAMTALRDRLRAGLLAVDGVLLNGRADRCACHIVNVSVLGVEGESLRLATADLAVAAGSACATAAAEPSAVLRALGRSDQLALSSLRFSLGPQTTAADVDRAVAVFRAGVTRLRALAPASRVAHA